MEENDSEENNDEEEEEKNTIRICEILRYVNINSNLNADVENVSNKAINRLPAVIPVNV